MSTDTQEALRREAKHELFIIDDVTTFKGILKACHNEIRNNEGSDPTEAFDELSKVMFCKLYEEKERPRDNRFRLSVFDDLDKMHINVVKQIFADAKSAPAYRDLMAPDDQINLQDRTIRKIVQLFENYDLGLTAFDVKGEAFEFSWEIHLLVASESTSHRATWLNSWWRQSIRRLATASSIHSVAPAASSSMHSNWLAKKFD